MTCPLRVTTGHDALPNPRIPPKLRAVAKAVYIFGSIARGDYRADSDVDIYVETAITGCETAQDFIDFHEGADGFAILLSGKIGRDVHVHRMVLSEPTDHARLGACYVEAHH